MEPTVPLLSAGVARPQPQPMPRPASDPLLLLSAPTPLPFLAAVLSLVLGGMAFWRIFMVAAPAGPGLAWLAAASALVAFTVATFNWNKADLGKWSGPLAALLVELLLLNVLASFAVAGDTRYFTLFLIISMGLAGWLLEPHWFLLTWLVGAGLWLSIAMMVDRPWETQMGRVAGGFALSALLLFAKQFIWRRQQALMVQEAQERRELAELKAALAEHREEQRRLEEELARTHARAERLAAASTEVLAEHDEEGKFLFATPACKTLLGCAPSALLGQPLSSFVHRDELSAVQAARQSVLEVKEPQTVSCRVRRLDGQYVWVELTLRPVKPSEIRPVLRFVSAMRNLTPLRELESDWLAAEKEQQNLQRQLADAEERRAQVEAAWKAADAARLNSLQLKQLAEDEKRREAQARAEAEAARMQADQELAQLRQRLEQIQAMAPTAAAGGPADAAAWLADLDRLTGDKRRLEQEVDLLTARIRQVEAELDRGQNDKRRLELELDQERRARQRGDAAHRAAEDALNATEAALRKLEAELRTAKAEITRLETDWIEGDAKRQQAEKERQRLAAALAQAEEELAAGQQADKERSRLKSALANLEQELQLSQQLAEEAERQKAEQQRQLDQLRRTLQELQNKRGKDHRDQQDAVAEAFAMLKELPVLLLTWDTAGRLKQRAGGGFAQLGWEPDVSAASHLDLLLAATDELAEAIRQTQAGSDFSLETERESRRLFVQGSPWRNSLGEVAGLLGWVQDVTAQRHAESKLKEQRERLDRLREKPTAAAPTMPELPSMRLLPYDPAEMEPQVEGPLPRFTGKVLLVEERREPQRVMTFLLERFGLDVEVADFADQAEDLAAGGRFDLIFLARSMLRKESNLPGKLRARGVAAPLLALLEAEASPALEGRCKEQGCDAVLRLPLTPPRLAEVLGSFLAESSKDPEEPTLELPLFSRHRQDPGFSGMIRGFVEELPTKMAELWSALCVADLAQLVKGVHQLKEAATLYGYPEMNQQAGRLEQAVLEGQSAAALRAELKELERLSRRCQRGIAA